MAKSDNRKGSTVALPPHGLLGSRRPPVPWRLRLFVSPQPAALELGDLQVLARDGRCVVGHTGTGECQLGSQCRDVFRLRIHTLKESQTVVRRSQKAQLSRTLRAEEVAEPYLTLEQISKTLNVSTKTIRRWRNRGRTRARDRVTTGGASRGGVLTPATALGGVLVERLRHAGVAAEPSEHRRPVG